MKYFSTMHDLESRQCYLCRKLHDDYSEKPMLHHHHVFGGPYKGVSERYGFIVHLCPYHHEGDINGNREAVHGSPHSKEYSDILKRDAQRIFERDHSRQEFIQAFGKSRLEEEEEMSYNNPIHIFVASSLWLPSDSEGWAGFILEAKLTSGMIKTRPAEQDYLRRTTPDASRLQMILSALEKLRVKGEIVIHMDDARIAGQWQQDLPRKWQQAGWKTTRGTEVKNRSLWEQILQSTEGDEVRILEDSTHKWVQLIQSENRKKAEDRGEW